MRRLVRQNKGISHSERRSGRIWRILHNCSLTPYVPRLVRGSQKSLNIAGSRGQAAGRRLYGWGQYKQVRLFFLTFCLLFIGSVTPASASQDDSTSTLTQYLSEEKSSLTLANQQAKMLTEQPRDQRAVTLRKRQNQSMLTLIEAKIVSLDSFLLNQRKQQQNLTSQLKKLQLLPISKSDGVTIQQQIAKMNALNEANNQTIGLIVENLALAHRYQDLLRVENQQLDVWQAKIDEERRMNALTKRIVVLEQARSTLYKKNVELQLEKNADTSFSAHLNKESKLLLNNQAISLIQYRITGLEVQKKLLAANYLLIRNQDVKTIQSVTDTYKSAISQLDLINDSLKKIVRLLQNERDLVADGQLKQQFLHIQKTASLRLTQITAQQKKLQEALLKNQSQLLKQLSVRQGLTEYHLNSWPSITHQLFFIPLKCYHYIQSLALSIQGHFVWQDPWLSIFYWVSLFTILFVAVILRQLLKAVTLDQERQRLAGHLYDGILILLYRNIPYLTSLACLFLTCFLTRIPYVKYELLVNLLLVWIMFRSFILIARLVLLENLNDSSGQDVRLYYRLKWLLIVGGWTTALMLLSHQLPLSLLLADIFNRLFMLFLLAVSWVAWKSKDIIPYLLHPILKTKKRYVRHSISLLTILVPLILLTTAVIGLIGYIHLAWTLSRYQAYLLLLITGYVLVRGLVFDALEFGSEWMIASLHNGWLWIEVFLKPLDKMLRVTLILLSIVILFQLFGWYSDAFVMGTLQRFGHYPLVNVSGVHITLVSFLKFILLLCFFTWISKWTREFCYRWLYRNTSDAGIRNSLAVFTQYAIILMGSFITLRVLGLDFSGMSMVLGGLAVGMGFGLRDFASNIVGGIMLLIERPVREGDVITLGEYEGRVAHIGIRSMRVSSWDNMEVLIPNAETFNKPFTNWTHQDSVVRTVVPIKVSRADDPVMIQEIISDVLAVMPEILVDPEPQVFLKQIDDALIEFEVRYYINIQLYTRFEIRSKVLFALTAAFKTAGVKPPIPPFSVEIKGDDGIEKPPAE